MSCTTRTTKHCPPFRQFMSSDSTTLHGSRGPRAPTVVIVVVVRRPRCRVPPPPRRRSFGLLLRPWWPRCWVLESFDDIHPRSRTGIHYTVGIRDSLAYRFPLQVKDEWVDVQCSGQLLLAECLNREAVCRCCITLWPPGARFDTICSISQVFMLRFLRRLAATYACMVTLSSL